MPLLPCPEPYPHWLCTDPATGDLLRVVPERGGLVTGWRCGGRERLYLDEERFADPTLSVRGGIPVLFPICGNLPGDRLVLPQGTYTLLQHGFARDLPWTLEPLAADPATGAGEGVRLELAHGPDTLRCFPFPFSLVLEIRLAPGALEIKARVHNPAPPGGAALPFSLGLHPYLAVADPARARIEGLPGRCRDHTTGSEEATAPLLARLGQGVDFLCNADGPVRLVDPVGGSALTLTAVPPLDRVVVWTDPPRPMVCLEPWSGPRGALAHGEGRLEVAPGARLELSCRYAVTDL